MTWDTGKGRRTRRGKKLKARVFVFKTQEGTEVNRIKFLRKPQRKWIIIFLLKKNPIKESDKGIALRRKVEKDRLHGKRRDLFLWSSEKDNKPFLLTTFFHCFVDVQQSPRGWLTRFSSKSKLCRITDAVALLLR